MIEDRLTILDKLGELKNRVLNVLDQKVGVANDFVYWGLLVDELLETVLDLIPLSIYRLSFRMLVDLKIIRVGSRILFALITKVTDL